MDTRTPCFPVRKLFPVHWITDIPNERALFVWPLWITTPVGLFSLERSYHYIVVKLHLDRIRVIRPFDKFYVFRICRIGDVQDRPPAMPFVTHVEIPASRHLPDRHLKCTAATIEPAVT